MRAKTLFMSYVNQTLGSALNVKLYRPQSLGWDLDILPKKVWGTKGFQFWTLLALLLYRSGCKTVLELGSGRSTVTIAEYAKFSGARFVSIESSDEWLQKWRIELRFLGIGLEKDPVYLVPVDPATGWYELTGFRAAIGGISEFDCAFIDGPNDELGRSQGMRDASIALEELRSRVRGAEIIIVDDVHRRHVLDTLAKTYELEDYDTCFYNYQVQEKFPNTVSISVRKSSPAAAAMPELERFLNLDLKRGFTAEDCPEE